MIETKNKKLYQDRFLLKKELAHFIVKAAVTQSYDEATINAIIDFTCNIMVLPPKLEENFIRHCQENFMQMENTNQLTGSALGFANAFSEAFFKQPYTVVLQQMENAKKSKAAKLKAEKAEKAAKLKAEKVIYKLHFEQQLSTSVIALIVEETEAYVQQVITNHQPK